MITSVWTVDDHTKTRPRTVVKFAIENFAVASAVALIVSTMGAAIFVSGYLSVFDWRLIWFVEYTDFIKFGLLVVAMVASSIFLIENMISLFFGSVNRSASKLPLKIRVLFGFLVLSSFITFFYTDYISSRPMWGFHSALVVTVIMALLLIATFRQLLVRPPIVSDGTVAVGFLFFLGILVAHYVREGSTFQDTILLEGRTIDNVGIVMFTSHHAIFFAEDGSLVVVPSGSIKEVRSKGRRIAFR